MARSGCGDAAILASTALFSVALARAPPAARVCLPAQAVSLPQVAWAEKEWI